jgi:aspartate/methionine/tyrosine aminotransferase
LRQLAGLTQDLASHDDVASFPDDFAAKMRTALDQRNKAEARLEGAIERRDRLKARLDALVVNRVSKPPNNGYVIWPNAPFTSARPGPIVPIVSVRLMTARLNWRRCAVCLACRPMRILRH